MTTAPTATAVRLLGYAGLIPFAAAAALAALGPPPWSGTALSAMVAYGAVILSFVGAVHWGLALRAPPEEAPAVWPRTVLGVLPALVGLVGLLLPAPVGSAVLAIGLLAVAATETAATRRGLLAPSYLRLRWALSLAAAACLFLGAAAARPELG